ncbi:CHAP domain-containing protein [Variovorax sp. KK3]|uniref:CHAP domain-containing protein n=1 Tax=Variovorax sp. KK3 TaxID=1855728 RepID=UPI0009F90D27|nr:CHAP domain-containing protein [Variovorax sp. KK3]
MDYPGRIIKPGEADASVVKAVRAQLRRMMAGNTDPATALDADDAVFDADMKRVVKLFQARHVDSEGRPLKQDGEIGSLTWGALFGVDTVAAEANAGSDLLTAVLDIASAEEAKKVREVPMNSNRGPDVEKYLARVGVPAGLPWCCAFVYYCFDEAAKQLGRANPMVRTAGCLDHWNRAVAKGATRIPAARATADPTLLRPGMIFIMDHGKGTGHTGLIESVSAGILATIEGNTDASKTREGGGVYRLARKVGEINKGFIDYGPVG